MAFYHSLMLTGLYNNITKLIDIIYCYHMIDFKIEYEL